MHICICLQPGNSDLFKGHGLASPEGGLWIELQLQGEGLAQLGDKAQRWNSSKV